PNLYSAAPWAGAEPGAGLRPGRAKEGQQNATVTMPQMGFDMQEGTLVRWLKQPGDQVAKGEPIAEIETDKAVIEIEAFESGTVKELLVEEGATRSEEHTSELQSRENLV